MLMLECEKKMRMYGYTSLEKVGNFTKARQILIILNTRTFDQHLD